MQKKVSLAGHVSRRLDGKWSKAVLTWQPVGARCKGRPLMRWCDAINRLIDDMSATLGKHIDWMKMAQDRDAWKTLEQQFVFSCSR